MSSAGPCLSLPSPLPHTGAHHVGSALRLPINTWNSQSTAPKLRRVLPASSPRPCQDQQRVELAQDLISSLCSVKSDDSHSMLCADPQMKKYRSAEAGNEPSCCSSKTAENANIPVSVKMEEPGESGPSLCAEESSGTCHQSGHMRRQGASRELATRRQSAEDSDEQKPTGENRKASLQSECEEPSLSPRSEKKRMKRFR